MALSYFVFISLIILLIIVVSILYYVLIEIKKGDPNHSNIKEMKKLLVKMDPKYENLDLRVANRTTTLDKKTILYCAIDPDTGRPYSQNTLIGVLIHELAHYESKSYGKSPDDHNDEWKDTYIKLKQKAAEVGIYDPKFPPPKKYCKMD